MLRKSHNIFAKPMIILSLALAFLGACKEETGLIGLGILPDTDTLSSQIYTDKTILAKTFIDDSIRLDMPSSFLLGSVNDQNFGKTAMNIITQFRVLYSPEWRDTDNPNFVESIADSLVLRLVPDTVYGDDVTPVNFKVYELPSSLTDREYYSYEDLSQLKGNNVVGEEAYISRRYLEKVPDTSTKIDTLDSVEVNVLHDIKIKLNNELMDKFFNADKEVFKNKDNFSNFFNGFYIEAEQVEQAGNYSVINAGDNPSVIMNLYYRDIIDTSSTEEIKLDTLSKSYGIFVTEFAKQINYFQHDYSNAVFYPEIMSGAEDTLMYLQATGGTKVEFTLPDINKLAEEQNLYFSGESLNSVLTKAEIIFAVDTVMSDPDSYILPQNIILSYIDTIGNNILPIDPNVHSLSPDYYGGVLENNEYRFRITSFFDDLLNNEVNYKKLILSTTHRNSSNNSVILKGPGSSSPIRFEISYTEL